MSKTRVQRNYKDTIFRMLIKDRENLLSLYNALNRTNYTDVDGLEITTLENAVYMNYKNDVSFVFGCELMIYEHQSTMNPTCRCGICSMCRIHCRKEPMTETCTDQT